MTDVDISALRTVVALRDDEGGPRRGFASESLTTAFCIEAMERSL